jgi:CubicO group peptidase (beta-lactamase class C family)
MMLLSKHAITLPWLAILLIVGLFQPLTFGKHAHNERSATRGADGHNRDVVFNVNDILEPVRRRYGLPAMAAAVVKNNKTIALGAVGVRRAGKNESVTLDDRFHIGSCAKAMTATLCAILVQEGTLKWESTIESAFPKQVKFLPEYKNITLEQLLTHRSGLPNDTNPDSSPALKEIYRKISKLTGPMLQQRQELAEIWLSQVPSPVEQFNYSNGAYDVAGAMCERVTNRTYECLLREKILDPLGMKTAGFGAPGSAALVDQPWGHYVENGKLKPVRPDDPEADNPACTGPSGTMYCSMADWAKFAALHLRGENGNNPMLPADVFRKLHIATPCKNDYAFGWYVRPERKLWHSGYNGKWYAVIWLNLKTDTACMVATNVYSEPNSANACDVIVDELLTITNDLGHP